MGRINYSDEEDFPGQFGLWQGNCRRSMRSRRGQAALRELEAALVAMPDKRLWREVFVQPTGEACALGAVMVHRKQSEGLSPDEAVAVCADVDPYDSQEAGERMGFPPLVAWAVVAENDVELDFKYVTAEGPSEYPYGYTSSGISVRVEITPEERHAAMLAWVRSKIITRDEAQDAAVSTE